MPGANPPPGLGSFPGPTLPPWMDTEGKKGKLQILKMEAVGSNLPKDPFIIKKSIDQHLQNTIEGAYAESKFSAYTLKVRNSTHAESLKTLDTLIDGTPIRIFDHPSLNQAKCLVTHYNSIDMDEEKLLKYLNEQGQGVKEVRRFKKRNGNDFINTATMVLTMDSTTVPEHIWFGYERCQTRTYYPSPMVCYHCYEFGHTKGRCPNKEKGEVCGHCSGTHPPSSDRKCANQMFCSRCSTNEHQLFSRKCPKYVDEDTIQKLRVDMDISYPAAKAIFAKRTGKNSTAAVVNQSVATEMNQMKEMLSAMSKRLEESERKYEERDVQFRRAVDKLKASNKELVKRNKILEDNLQQALVQSAKREQAAIQLTTALQKSSPYNATLKAASVLLEEAKTSCALKAKNNKKRNTDINIEDNNKRPRSRTGSISPADSDSEERMEYEAPLPDISVTQILDADAIIIGDEEETMDNQ